LKASSGTLSEPPSRTVREISGSTHSPPGVIPIGKTSYLSVSMAAATCLADMQETSCSADLPPNRRPTRVFKL
jgi:hypothetical protein